MDLSQEEINALFPQDNFGVADSSPLDVQSIKEYCPPMPEGMLMLGPNFSTKLESSDKYIAKLGSILFY
jgi:hypothetical protein